MLQRIIAVFSQPKITPIVLQRPSRIPVVFVCNSAFRVEQVKPVFGRLA